MGVINYRNIRLFAILGAVFEFQILAKFMSSSIQRMAIYKYIWWWSINGNICGSLKYTSCNHHFQHLQHTNIIQDLILLSTSDIDVSKCYQLWQDYRSLILWIPQQAFTTFKVVHHTTVIHLICQRVKGIVWSNQTKYSLNKPKYNVGFNLLKWCK